MTGPCRLTDEALLRRLVAFDSSSERSNLAIADFIADYVERPGIRVTRNPSPDAGKINLVIAAGPDDGTRRGLVLSGHMDTVPPGEQGWRSDPLVLTRVGDAYVARGACDMKGFLALAVNRLAEIDIGRLEHQLVLIFTYDEEVGTLGAKRLAETWQEPGALPRAAIIGEPTSLAAVRMHKGHLKLRLSLTGVPAHSAYPHLGKNAIESAGPVLQSLRRLRRSLETERSAYSECFGEVPFVTLNVATIRGGVAINVIPEQCAIELGIRLLPGMATGDMIERVRETVASAAGETAFALEVIGDSPPMVLADGAPIHRGLCAHLNQPDSKAVSFATDAGWLQGLGMECVIFGPGSIEVAHKPNESLPVAEFVRARELLTSLIHEACEAGSSA